MILDSARFDIDRFCFIITLPFIVASNSLVVATLDILYEQSYKNRRVFR
jgi:hypothetical protein